MRKPITAPGLLAALALSATVAPASAPAEEAIPIGSAVAITPLPVRAPLETAEARFTDVALYVIGAPDTESLGVSIRATVVPKHELTGKEKAVLYFYATCDDEPPARSVGVPVATLELGQLPAGRAARSLLTTATATALVPLSSVACAKLAVVCAECGEQTPPYIIRQLDLALDRAVRDISVDGPTLALVGEPASKSFGTAFRGTVRPMVELTGDEKAVIRLYTGCIDDKSSGPDAIKSPGSGATNVATIELGSLPAGTDRHRLTTTKEASAFVPMQDIGCAVIDME